MTDEEFYHFCEQNKHTPIERDKNHQILFMPPVTSEFSKRNGRLNGYLFIWNLKFQLGRLFDSSSGFYLPDGSMKSPDAAWVSHERWNALSEDKRKGFAYIAPDFIVELASPSDSLAQLKNKMEEWQRNGVQLGWLIDTKTETVFIYRADGTISKTEGFDSTLSGEVVLPGFEFRPEVLR
ncbi:MAG: Uma2 family endonuclease [Sphingobacteriaceae bacterium]|nr:MAG: Uma2 family endonuclease [Sphingobacteriaceae bacterium]